MNSVMLYNPYFVVVLWIPCFVLSFAILYDHYFLFSVVSPDNYNSKDKLVVFTMESKIPQMVCIIFLLCFC